jgi:hypothetical protein
VLIQFHALSGLISLCQKYLISRNFCQENREDFTD